MNIARRKCTGVINLPPAENRSDKKHIILIHKEVIEYV